jgi:hypothetical protein
MRTLLRTDLPGGRRQLRLDAGPYSVTVTEVPGQAMSGDEWDSVQLARLSYVAMWGCGDRSDIYATDRMDGLGADAERYDARHYLAWVRDGVEPARLLTTRKVTLRPAALTAAERADPGEWLPLDVGFWHVRPGGFPLWEPLSAHLRGLAPDDDLAHFRIACLGRVGTFPFERRPAARRDATAVAWAATQVLAAHADPHLLWAWTICDEFQDRVMVVHDVDGTPVRPAFIRTEELLGLPRGSVSLDNGLEAVQQHKAGAPGYFVDNDDAAEVLAGLLERGRITIADLWPTIARLVESQAAAGGIGPPLDGMLHTIAASDHRGLAEVLTRPRAMKHLIPLLAGEEPLCRMSHGELRMRLLCETGDGPFSASALPETWSVGAWEMLRAVERRYAAGVDRWTPDVLAG